MVFFWWSRGFFGLSLFVFGFLAFFGFLSRGFLRHFFCFVSDRKPPEEADLQCKSRRNANGSFLSMPNKSQIQRCRGADLFNDPCQICDQVWDSMTAHLSRRARCLTDEEARLPLLSTTTAAATTTSTLEFQGRPRPPRTGSKAKPQSEPLSCLYLLALWRLHAHADLGEVSSGTTASFSVPPPPPCFPPLSRLRPLLSRGLSCWCCGLLC